MPRCSLRILFHPKALMGTAAYIAPRCSAGSASFSLLRRRSLHLSRVLVSFRPASSVSRRCSWQRFYSYRPVVVSNAVQMERTEEDKVVAQQVALLIQALEKEGIQFNRGKLGQYTRSLCPQCKGGSSREISLSVFVREDGEFAYWSCHRAKCGWKGRVLASGDVKTTFTTNEKASKVAHHRMLTEENLHLEPLCQELINYFHERMISAETLRRNAVMQRRYNDEIVIAFTYRRKGALVSCKYRTVSKRFWQETDAERIFYGLDDIEQSNDIIIVEGEMDKLSLEEAGYRNCVSVPDGAPAQVSEKLPHEKEVFHIRNAKFLI